MAIDFRKEINIDTIQNALTDSRGISLQVLRLDQLHPVVSGNKWFKLKYNLEAAKASGAKGVLTFGGAYSNHLIATAAAAAAAGLSSVGIVRGLHGKEKLTPTLQSCREYGMHLHFISRAEYGLKEDLVFLEKMKAQFRDCFFIPEGGDNDLGRKGTAEIAGLIPVDITHVAVAIGSGATFAGLRNGLSDEIALLGITAMKDGAYMKEELSSVILQEKANWTLFADYHFGGFAKYTPELVAFMNTFYKNHSIPLDMVYNAKMMWGVFDLMQQDYFPPGSKVMCIHSGGLQGNASIQAQLCYNSIF